MSSCPPTARSWATASRPARCSWRAGSRAARSRSTARGSSTSRSWRRSSARWGCGLAHARRDLGAGRRPPARRRRRDAPVPGLRHRLHAASSVALLAMADGTGIVTENVFDNRLSFVAELNRMGADVRHEGRHAVVRGVERLSGAPVRALDVRAGAALVLAGLRADGETVCSTAATSTAATPTSPRRSGPSGADVDRGPARAVRGRTMRQAVIVQHDTSGVAEKPCDTCGAGRTACRLRPQDPADMEPESSRRSSPSAPRSRPTAATSCSSARRRRCRVREPRRRLRHVPGLDADAEGRRRADHHGPRAGRHRGHRRLLEE